MSTKPPCMEGTDKPITANRALALDLVNPERAQARNVVDAVFFLSEAKRALAEKGGNGDVFAEVLKADEDLSRFLIILLGINPENEGDQDRVKWWESLSREDHLNMPDGGAWNYHDRVTASLGRALQMAYTFTRAKAALTPLQNAQGALLLDRGLFSARRTDAPVIGRPGRGHGSVDLMCKRVYQSTVYDRRWFHGDWLKSYRIRGSAHLRGQLSQYIRIQNSKHRVIGLVCDVYDEPALRECRVMHAFKALWMDCAEAYKAIIGGPLADGWATGVDFSSQAGQELPMCKEVA